MKRRMLTCFWISAAVVLLASCSKQTELTRGKAQSVLSGSTPGVSQFALGQSQLKAGLTDGMWGLVGAFGGIMTQCQVTPKGQAIFKGCWQGTVNLKASPSGYAVEVLKPIPTRVAEITGMTDAGQPGLKQVELTYKLDIPENLKRYIRPETYSGSAVLRLYDDGWRVADFSGGAIIATEDVVVAESWADRKDDAIQLVKDSKLTGNESLWALIRAFSLKGKEQDIYVGEFKWNAIQRDGPGYEVTLVWTEGTSKKVAVWRVDLQTKEMRPQGKETADLPERLRAGPRPAS